MSSSSSTSAPTASAAQLVQSALHHTPPLSHDSAFLIGPYDRTPPPPNATRAELDVYESRYGGEGPYIASTAMDVDDNDSRSLDTGIVRGSILKSPPSPLPNAAAASSSSSSSSSAMDSSSSSSSVSMSEIALAMQPNGAYKLVGEHPQRPAELMQYTSDRVSGVFTIQEPIDARDATRYAFNRVNQAITDADRVINVDTNVMDFTAWVRSVRYEHDVTIGLLNSFVLIAQSNNSLHQVEEGDDADDDAERARWATRANAVDELRTTSRLEMNAHMVKALSDALSLQDQEFAMLINQRKIWAQNLISDAHKATRGAAFIVAARVQNTDDTVRKLAAFAEDARHAFSRFAIGINTCSAEFRATYLTMHGKAPPCSRESVYQTITAIVLDLIDVADAVHVYTAVALEHYVYAGAKPMRGLGRGRVNFALALYHQVYMFADAAADAIRDLLRDFGIATLSDRDYEGLIVLYARLLRMSVDIVMDVQCLGNVVWSNNDFRKMAFDMMRDFLEDAHQYAREFNYHCKSLQLADDDGVTRMGDHVERVAARCNRLLAEVVHRFDMVPSISLSPPTVPSYIGARIGATDAEYEDAFPGRSVKLVPAQGYKISDSGEVSYDPFDNSASSSSAASSSAAAAAHNVQMKSESDEEQCEDDETASKRQKK